MLKLLLFCILLVLCWPLAIALVVLYPLIWLISLPFRIVGLSFQLVLEIFRLPIRVLRSV